MESPGLCLSTPPPRRDNNISFVDKDMAIEWQHLLLDGSKVARGRISPGACSVSGSSGAGYGANKLGLAVASSGGGANKPTTGSGGGASGKNKKRG